MLTMYLEVKSKKNLVTRNNFYEKHAMLLTVIVKILIDNYQEK